MLHARANSLALLDALLQGGAGADTDVAVATRAAGGWHRLSRGELVRRSEMVAARLADQGVEPGARVVLSAEPGGEWLAALLGIVRRGAVAVPLDPRLTQAERDPMIARTEPAAVLQSSELEQITADDGHPPAHAGSDRAGADQAMIVWTSGTSGAPKGVTLTYANLGYSVEQAVLGQRPQRGDRWLSVLPAHHLLELCCGVLPALASGGSVWFARTLMPHEMVAIVRDIGITRMVAVPLLLRLLENSVQGSGLHTIYCGGAPLEPAVVERYASKGIAVYPGYGLTEAAPTVSMNSPAAHRPGSVGRPLAGTEVRIAGPPASGEGEILVRSPAVMQGYWRDGVLTAEAIDDEGWLHTGDLGYVDDDGYLFVTGRAKRLIVLESGKKVQPEEVEEAIRANDLFADVCVVAAGGGPGIPEKVCAVVVPAPALATAYPERQRLQEAATGEVARATSGLSGYKKPSVVMVHNGSLPRTLKGSPRHTEVARMVEQGTLS